MLLFLLVLVSTGEFSAVAGTDLTITD
jgi:hypothetical protein